MSILIRHRHTIHAFPLFAIPIATNVPEQYDLAISVLVRMLVIKKLNTISRGHLIWKNVPIEMASFLTISWPLVKLPPLCIIDNNHFRTTFGELNTLAAEKAAASLQLDKMIISISF